MKKAKEKIITAIIVVVSYSLILLLQKYIIGDYSKELRNDMTQMCNSYVAYRGQIGDMDICDKYQDILRP